MSVRTELDHEGLRFTLRDWSQPMAWIAGLATAWWGFIAVSVVGLALASGATIDAVSALCSVLQYGALAACAWGAWGYTKKREVLLTASALEIRDSSRWGGETVERVPLTEVHTVGVSRTDHHRPYVKLALPGGRSLALLAKDHHEATSLEAVIAAAVASPTLEDRGDAADVPDALRALTRAADENFRD